MKKISLIILAAITISSCQQNQSVSKIDTIEKTKITYNTEDASSIIKAIEQASGTWNKLWEQKDVQFTYDYFYPATSQKDLSTERYIFNDESSFAKYTVHQINALPKEEGDVIQCLTPNGNKVILNNQKITDAKTVGTGQFLRKANYFWFTMMFKLGDKGTIHEYLGQEELNGSTYDKVKVTYESQVTNKEQNDTYILYVNPKTNLVDRFFFSLPAFGINEAILLMEVSYEEINGLKLPSLRKVYSPSEDGSYPKDAWVIQTSKNIQFNNGFTAENIINI